MKRRTAQHKKPKPAKSTEPVDRVPQTPKARKLAFLMAYEAGGSLTRAAEAAGVCRRSHYRWLDEDPAYAKEHAAAKTRAIDSLESVAWERAFDGSDLLLIFLLKSANPAKYRDRFVPQPGTGDESLADIMLAIQQRHGFSDQQANADGPERAAN